MSITLRVVTMQDDEEERCSEGWRLVAADHPKLGRLYWRYCDESSLNAPDFYGITDTARLASWVKEGWRSSNDLYAQHYSDMSSLTARNFIYELFNSDRLDSNYFEFFNWDEREGVALFGDLAVLQSRSGQSVEEFVQWVQSATWFDTPIPPPAL